MLMWCNLLPCLASISHPILYIAWHQCFHIQPFVSTQRNLHPLDYLTACVSLFLSFCLLYFHWSDYWHSPIILPTALPLHYGIGDTVTLSFPLISSHELHLVNFIVNEDLKRWIGNNNNQLCSMAPWLLRNKWEITERKRIFCKILVELLNVQKNHQFQQHISNMNANKA